MSESAPRPRTPVLIANPSADVYGSDLQMLESVRALRAEREVVVVMPATGPLVPRLEAAGARVELVDFPVLRRANASVTGLVSMVLAAVVALPRMWRTVRRVRPGVLYVNTVTLPWWLLIGQITRTPTLCHVHEAETEESAVIRRALLWPLRLADVIICNGTPARRAIAAVSASLVRSAHVIYNGVPWPPEDTVPARFAPPIRLAVVGRLNPRKAPDIALEVVAELGRRGHDVRLEVAGSAFAGYDAYEGQLRERADMPDLSSRVTFSGYQSPIWPVLERADVVLAPSRIESFGNVVVEAQAARRPVVAVTAAGHLEIIDDGRTGLLVPPGDVQAMADATERLINDPDGARQLAERAAESARRRFSTARYKEEIVQLVADTARP